MASAHPFPRMPAWALTLYVEMDVVFRFMDVVYYGF
jgi:hypothetical protein